MKKHYLLMTVSLLFSLLIYLFYRTEKTVINEIFLWFISPDKFMELRANIAGRVLLNEHLIYSLPGGLWVFCVTLTSKFLFIKIDNREFNLLFAPLLFSIGLELFQLLHLTNGRFDFWDIGFSVLFWAAANYLTLYKSARQNILHPFNLRSLICLFSYMIVYLAHVWK